MQVLKITIYSILVCSLVTAKGLTIKDYLKNPEFYMKNNFEEVKRFLPNRSLKIEKLDTQYWQNNIWEDSLRYQYSYNNSGEIEETIYYNLVNGNSINYGKLIYSYDENNQIETAIWQDYENDEWLNNYKYSYFYVEETVLSQCLYEEWIDDAWLAYSIGDYQFNENNELTTEIWQYWLNANDLVNWTKNEYSYDLDSNIVENFGLTWEENVWANSYRYEYSYQNDNIISYFYQYWDSDNYINYYQYNYQYSESDLINYTFYSEWYEGWLEVSQGAFEYDEDDNLTWETWQTWQNNFLENDIRYYYEYSETSSSEADYINPNDMELLAYPNPYSINIYRNDIKITYNLSQKSTVNLNIYNIKGQKVSQLINNRQEEAGKNTVRWKTSDKIVNGIYLIQLQADKSQKISRIIITK